MTASPLIPRLALANGGNGAMSRPPGSMIKGSTTVVREVRQMSAIGTEEMID